MWASEVESPFFLSNIEHDRSPEPLTTGRRRAVPQEHCVSGSWILFSSYFFLTKLSHPILPLALFLFISNREFLAVEKSLCMCTKEEAGEEGKLVNLQINT